MVYAKKDSFQKEVSEGLVLADFFATWCGPCKMLGPVLEEIDHENPELVKIVKIDVDQEPELSSFYNITAVPTMILFKNGEPVTRMMGFKMKPVLLNTIRNYQ